MKFIHAVLAFSVIVSLVSATPTPHKWFMKRDVNANLIPQFGVTPGIPLANSASCAGINGPNNVPIAIPCQCPPNREQFIADLNANVAAGHCINNTAVSVPAFPTDDSPQSQLLALHIATITLQNLQGPGKGCPQSSTTWAAQAQAIQNAANSAPPAAPPSVADVAPPAASSTPATSAPLAASSTPATLAPPAASTTPAASACPAPSPSS